MNGHACRMAISEVGQNGAVPATSTRGMLLLATPPLVDPNFDRTVVYVLEHNDQGALGVVLNRMIDDEEVLEVLAEWAPTMTEPGGVFYGGPVEMGGVIGLTAREGGVEPVDLDESPDERFDHFRLFRGYSG